MVSPWVMFFSIWGFIFHFWWLQTDPVKLMVQIWNSFQRNPWPPASNLGFLTSSYKKWRGSNLRREKKSLKWSVTSTVKRSSRFETSEQTPISVGIVSWATPWENLLWHLRPSKTQNGPAQLQKQAWVMTLQIQKLEIYYLGSEQQRRWSNCTDVPLLFA